MHVLKQNKCKSDGLPDMDCVLDEGYGDAHRRSCKLRNGEVVGVMEVNGGEQVIELHACSTKDLRLVFHAILRERLVHVQSFELHHVILQHSLPLVACRMLVVLCVPIQDLVDRLLRRHLHVHIAHSNFRMDGSRITFLLAKEKSNMEKWTNDLFCLWNS